jgi:hypothetical protein
MTSKNENTYIKGNALASALHHSRPVSRGLLHRIMGNFALNS